MKKWIAAGAGAVALGTALLYGFVMGALDEFLNDPPNLERREW